MHPLYQLVRKKERKKRDKKKSHTCERHQWGKGRGRTGCPWAWWRRRGCTVTSSRGSHRSFLHGISSVYHILITFHLSFFFSSLLLFLFLISLPVPRQDCPNGCRHLNQVCSDHPFHFRLPRGFLFRRLGVPLHFSIHSRTTEWRLISFSPPLYYPALPLPESLSPALSRSLDSNTYRASAEVLRERGREVKLTDASTRCIRVNIRATSNSRNN